jgi:Arc/MetJ family transcription regulator
MKHLVDIDDELLRQAMDCLGTSTIRATVDEALKTVTDRRRAELRRSFERFGELAKKIPLADRSEAW